MNVWTLVGLLGWVLPTLLIWWRSAREPRWTAMPRYLVAIAIVWLVLLTLTAVATDERVAAAEAVGDDDGVIGDTGANVATLMLGWLPASYYALLLGNLRWLCR